MRADELVAMESEERTKVEERCKVGEEGLGEEEEAGSTGD